MIVTDKYEGHTPGPWEAPHEILVSGLNHIGPLSNGQEEVNEVDAKLIADAPLLLAEVKRLRLLLLESEMIIDRLKRANDDAWRMLADDQGSEYND